MPVKFFASYQKEFQLAQREMIEPEKCNLAVNEELKRALKQALETQDK